MKSIYENEYEFCDFLHTFNFDNLENESERTIYVPKQIYDKQVNCGQETEAKVRRQISIDIPRSNFNIEGKPYNFCPEFIPLQVKKYCTQAVLATPVELFSKYGIVAERSKPTRMSINVYDFDVNIRKKLRFFNDKNWLPIDIKINVELDDPCVIITIKMK